MGMICLPGREEHGYARGECCEKALGCGPKAHGSHLAETGKSAIQRVDAMTLHISPNESSDLSKDTHSNSSPSPLD